jgi:alpha/beta superfamily hydrolase
VNEWVANNRVERMYNKSKVNVLMLEYRGFGNNSGEPTQAGMQLDGRAALEYVRNRRDLLQGPARYIQIYGSYV